MIAAAGRTVAHKFMPKHMIALLEPKKGHARAFVKFVQKRTKIKLGQIGENQGEMAVCIQYIQKNSIV